MYVFQKNWCNHDIHFENKTSICTGKCRFSENQMTVLQVDFVFLHDLKKTVFFPICNVLSDSRFMVYFWFLTSFLNPRDFFTGFIETTSGFNIFLMENLKLLPQNGGFMAKIG